VDGQGRVIAAQKGKLVRYSKSGTLDATLVTSGNGASFNQANDFSLGKTGAVYFTDLGSQVYYADAQGKIKVAASGLNGANGIEWIEEENAVYVQAGRNIRYEIAADGSLINGKTFFNIDGPDGCEVDSHGNFYLASYTRGILYVVNSKGTEVGRITFKAKGIYDSRPGDKGNVDNCHFGGPELKTLYCTGDGGLYSIRMKVSGRAWPAGMPTSAVGRSNMISPKPVATKSFRADGRWWLEVDPANAPNLPALNLGGR
jgi:gluconolactonase